MSDTGHVRGLPTKGGRDDILQILTLINLIKSESYDCRGRFVLSLDNRITILIYMILQNCNAVWL